MQCHLILRIAHNVHSFHNIDLSIRRPVVWIGEPERRPSAAADGSVLYVEDEEPVGVLCFGAYAHGEAAGGGVGVGVGGYGCVNAQDGAGGAGVGQVEGFGFSGGDVVDEAGGGVVAGEVVEVVEEGCSGVWVMWLEYVCEVERRRYLHVSARV